MFELDRKIVAQLMRDATLPIAQIADRAGLSQTPAWKRIQKLESSGVLVARVALADPARLGFGLTVFVGIEAPDHSLDWREIFASAVGEIPEIMEVYRMAGELDHLLRVSVPDMAAFDALYKRLTDAVQIKNVTSHFAMERMKFVTAYQWTPGTADGRAGMDRPEQGGARPMISPVAPKPRLHLRSPRDGRLRTGKAAQEDCTFDA